MAKVDGFRALADVVSGSYENRTDTRYATVSRIADDGTVYVRFPGGEDMPVHSTLATVAPGDSVPVTIAKGRATIRANATDLPASSTSVERVGDDALQALKESAAASSAAASAVASAAIANEAASQAVEDAATAKAAATQAQSDAADAKQSAADAAQDAASAASSAQSAQEDAQAASTAATSAQGSAATAATAAQQAQSDAADAASAAQSAQDDAASAQGSASQAAQSASTAQQQAAAATTAADEAKADAKTAKEQAASAVSDASTAKQAATEATATANGAVTALATVQGVVDTLEAGVDDLQTHVAMMDAYSDGHGGTVPAGLHVVPTGSGYFLVIANDGTYVYDAQSVLVTKFGESIDFSSTRPQRIGNETAYIEYYDSDNDGVPDAIRISGTNLNTAISSVQSTLNTKADSSTVQTLRSEYNETKTTVSGHETRLTATESVANGVRADFDNLEIGGRNLVQWSKLDYAPSESQTLHPTNPVTYYAEGDSTSTWELVTEDGYKCWHVAGDLAKTKSIKFLPTFKHESGIIRTASCDIKLVDYAAGTTNPFVALYVGGETIDGTWRAPRDVKHIWFRDVNNEGWVRVFTTWKWPEYAWTKPFYLQVYARDFTGDLYVKDVKLEEGNLPSPWTPAPEDLETEVTSLKTDYATYKQTTTEALSEIGTTYATKTELGTETSNRQTAIQQANDAIALKANSTDVYTKTQADGKVTEAVNAAKAEIKVTTDGISSEVEKKTDKASIISTIRQSAETVKIKASQVEIDGTAVFSAIKSQTDAAYDAAGSAATAESNAKGYVDGKGYQTATDVSTAVANGTANLAAKADAIARTQRIWYRQTADGAKPGKNLTWLSTSGTGYGNWSLTVPQLTDGSTKYPKLYTAVQSQTVAQQAAGATCSCSDVQLDDSTTVIDGGNIITGSVTANQIAGHSVSADQLTVGVNDSIADAAKTASNYIAADSTGIRIANANPSTATTYQHQSATETEFVVRGESTLKIGASGQRIGKENESHIMLDNDSLDLVSSEGKTVAYAAEDKFYAGKLEATSAFYLGDYSIRVATDGKLVIGRRR